MIDQMEQKINHDYCWLILATEPRNDSGFTGFKTKGHKLCPCQWSRQEEKDCLELVNVQSLQISALKDEVFTLREVCRSLQEDRDSQF